MGLSRTISQINSDFCRKSQFLPTPLVFKAHTEGIRLGSFVNSGSTQKTRVQSNTFSRNHCQPFAKHVHTTAIHFSAPLLLRFLFQLYQSVTHGQTDTRMCHNSIALCTHSHADAR